MKSYKKIKANRPYTHEELYEVINQRKGYIPNHQLPCHWTPSGANQVQQKQDHDHGWRG